MVAEARRASIVSLRAGEESRREGERGREALLVGWFLCCLSWRKRDVNLRGRLRSGLDLKTRKREEREGEGWRREEVKLTKEFIWVRSGRLEVDLGEVFTCELELRVGGEAGSENERVGRNSEKFQSTSESAQALAPKSRSPLVASPSS